MSRLLDLCVSLVLLLIFLPFGIVIAFVLRLTGEGEIFFLQERIGRKGKVFRLIKFATMLKNSPNMGTGTVTTRNDPRVLRFGRVLRKTKLNEVPQLINVLIGQMGLVGPRPLTSQTFGYYSSEIQAELREARPGLTGIGSIVFRDEESLLGKSTIAPLDFYKDTIAPYKGSLEVWYVRHKSMWLDLKLICLTALVVLVPSLPLQRLLPKGLPPAPWTMNVNVRP